MYHIIRYQVFSQLWFYCSHTNETCRGVQQYRLLIQMLLLVRVGQMFAELATMNLDCKIAVASFRQKPANATGGLLERSVACHMLFGAESTIVTFLYMAVTMLQLEIVKRIEDIWTVRAISAHANGVQHDTKGNPKTVTVDKTAAASVPASALVVAAAGAAAAEQV